MPHLPLIINLQLLSSMGINPQFTADSASCSFNTKYPRLLHYRAKHSQLITAIQLCRVNGTLRENPRSMRVEFSGLRKEARSQQSIRTGDTSAGKWFRRDGDQLLYYNLEGVWGYTVIGSSRWWCCFIPGPECGVVVVVVIGNRARMLTKTV